MVGMSLETRTKTSIEIGMALLEDVEKIIDDLRKRGLSFHTEDVTKYLIDVNSALKTKNLNDIKKIIKTTEDPTNELKTHYTLAAYMHGLGWWTVGLIIDREITQTFEEIATQNYKVTKPLIIRLHKEEIPHREEGFVEINYRIKEIKFSESRPTINKIIGELNILSGRLRKGDSERDYLAFIGLLKFGLPFVGGFKEASQFYLRGEELKEKYGEVVLPLPKFFQKR